MFDYSSEECGRPDENFPASVYRKGSWLVCTGYDTIVTGRVDTSTSFIDYLMREP
jgi:hypothetical protein